MLTYTPPFAGGACDREGLSLPLLSRSSHKSPWVVIRHSWAPPSECHAKPVS